MLVVIIVLFILFITPVGDNLNIWSFGPYVDELSDDSDTLDVLS